MNYTENYHLPQWVETDRIMMEDFNAAMAGIEEGLTQGSLGAAESAAKAQAAADQALADAARAQAKADAAYAPDQPPYAVGSYTGTNQAVTINVGFRPKLVIITGSTSGSFDSTYTVTAGEGVMGSHVGFSNNGFTVYPLSHQGTPAIPAYPDLSDTGRKYVYIAFR